MQSIPFYQEDKLLSKIKNYSHLRRFVSIAVTLWVQSYLKRNVQHWLSRGLSLISPALIDAITLDIREFIQVSEEQNLSLVKSDIYQQIDSICNFLFTTDHDDDPSRGKTNIIKYLVSFINENFILRQFSETDKRYLSYLLLSYLSNKKPLQEPAKLPVDSDIRLISDGIKRLVFISYSHKDKNELDEVNMRVALIDPASRFATVEPYENIGLAFIKTICQTFLKKTDNVRKIMFPGCALLERIHDEATCRLPMLSLATHTGTPIKYGVVTTATAQAFAIPHHARTSQSITNCGLSPIQTGQDGNKYQARNCPGFVDWQSVGLVIVFDFDQINDSDDSSDSKPILTAENLNPGILLAIYQKISPFVSFLGNYIWMNQTEDNPSATCWEYIIHYAGHNEGEVCQAGEESATNEIKWGDNTGILSAKMSGDFDRKGHLQECLSWKQTQKRIENRYVGSRYSFSYSENSLGSRFIGYRKPACDSASHQLADINDIGVGLLFTVYPSPSDMVGILMTLQ